MVNNFSPPYPPLGPGYSTAGGRELELTSRPPARFISLSNLQRATKKKDTETTKTSRHRVTPLLAQPITLSGNSYFWRTGQTGVCATEGFLLQRASAATKFNCTWVQLLFR